WSSRKALVEQWSRLAHGASFAAIGAPQTTRGNAMRSLAPLGVLSLIVFAAPGADAATITGTITGPDGAPFRAAFVQARHAGLKMTVSVLTDNQGKYIVQHV